MSNIEYIHIRSLEKYHPGYKDRNLLWAKMYFGIVQGDPEFELIENEIDKWRYMAMICLELQAKKPLPNISSFWLKKGFDIKKRSMSLTLQVLHNFISVVQDESKTCVLDKNRIDKDKEEDKEEEVENCDEPETEFNKAMNNFIEYRKKIKKPLTEYAIKLLEGELTKLAGTDENLKIGILNQSIVNGWQGVFPLKENGNNAKQPVKNDWSCLNELN